MLALQCIKYFIPFRWLNCAWNVAGAGFSRAGLIRQHLLHWEKSVSFLISCQAAATLCLMVPRICHRFLSSYCHLLVCPPPPLISFPLPLSPLPLRLSHTHTQSSAVIREQGLYKGASWEPGSSPSVQPHHHGAHSSSNAGGRSRAGAPACWSSERTNFLPLPPLPPCLYLCFSLCSLSLRTERKSIATGLIHLALIRLGRW